MSHLKVGFFLELLWNKELSVNDGVGVLNSCPISKASLCEAEMYCCKILYCSSVRYIPSLGAMRYLSIRKWELLSVSGVVYIWELKLSCVFVATM